MPEGRSPMPDNSKRCRIDGSGPAYSSPASLYSP
jgi:hypothetical protein